LFCVKNGCCCKVSEITGVSIAVVNKQRKIVNKKRQLRNVDCKPEKAVLQVVLEELVMILPASFVHNTVRCSDQINPHQEAACDSLFGQDDRPGVLKGAPGNILCSSRSQIP